MREWIKNGILILLICVIAFGGFKLIYLRGGEIKKPERTENFDLNNLSEDILIGVGSGSSYGTIIDCSEHRYVINRDRTVDFFLEEYERDFDTNQYVLRYKYIGTRVTSDEAYENLEKLLDYKVINRLTCVEPDSTDICDGGWGYMYLYDKSGDVCWSLGGSNINIDGTRYDKLGDLIYECVWDAWNYEMEEAELYPEEYLGYYFKSYEGEEYDEQIRKAFLEVVKEECENSPEKNKYTFALRNLDKDEIPELIIDKRGEVRVFRYSEEDGTVTPLNYDFSYGETGRFMVNRYRNQAYRIEYDELHTDKPFVFELYSMDEETGFTLLKKQYYDIWEFRDNAEDGFYTSRESLAAGDMPYDDVVELLEKGAGNKEK